MAETGDEIWGWPESRWRAEIDRARAGRTLRPKKWKTGRCAVAVTFDCDFETRALNGASDIEALSDGQYGARAGVPRILRLLKKHGVQSTFFMPAVSALIHTDTAKSIAAAGHEIGLTSWIGERKDRLTIEAERDLLVGARSTLEATVGMKPSGFRAGRGGFSAHTIKVLRELELSYDSSLSADDDPYELTDGGDATGLVELPVGLDDATFFENSSGTSPEEVFDIFRRELEITSEEGGLLVLRLHPEIVGRRSRIWIIDEFIKVARTLPGTWLTTLADIAAFSKSKGGL